MRSRSYRIDVQWRKYVSRIKEHLYHIIMKEKDWEAPESWREADQKCKWVKMLKHNNFYSRNGFRVTWKHERIKHMRIESRKYEREAMSA